MKQTVGLVMDAHYADKINPHPAMRQVPQETGRERTCRAWEAISKASRSRPIRLVLLLMGLWTVNGFDLILTLTAHGLGGFREANPVAAHVLAWSPTALVAFKISLIVLASAILLAARRRPSAEIAAWAALTVYTFVAVRWYLYYAHHILWLEHAYAMAN